MMDLGIPLAALLGLVFGSFLNVCINRLPRHQSIVAPRSRCPQCEHPIAVRDNLPIASWLLLRGRCRHCHARISLRYPLVELLVAGLFVLCFLLFGPTLETLGIAVFCWLLVGLCITDAELLLLPDTLTWPGIVLGVLYHAATGLLSPEQPGMNVLRSGIHAAAWAGAGALGMLAIRWAYAALRGRMGLGLGDVKLFAMIAAWLGLRQAALVFFLAVVGGAIYGVARVALTSAQKQKEPVKVPFGSFLCVAALYAVFMGHATLAWYLSFFR